MSLMEMAKTHKYRLLMALAALVIGILLLTIGFWKTLLLAIVTAIGYIIGTRKDGVWNQMVARVTGLLNRR